MFKYEVCVYYIENGLFMLCNSATYYSDTKLDYVENFYPKKYILINCEEINNE